MITQRIDGITEISSQYRGEFLPAPRSVKIEVTGRCNYACTFCARSMVLREQKDMDRAMFERLLPELHASGVEEIGLFYLGESFLCKWLAAAIAYAKHECGFPYVFLTTNGSLATPERMRECFLAGLDSLKFSFNYADVAQFKDIARVKAALYHKMFANVRAARETRDAVWQETGHRCGIYASYIEYDGEQGQRMQEALDQIRDVVDEIYALPLYNQANFVTETEKSKGWKPIVGNRGRVGALRDPLPCWAVFTEGHITWDGKLSACCFDHDGRFHMGDLTTTPFMEAWNSPVFQKLRAAHLKQDVAGTPCEQCLAYS